MKKLLTIVAAGAISLAVQAQNRQAKVVAPANRCSAAHVASQPAVGFTPVIPGLKGAAATAFFTDTFNSNSFNTGGWVAGGNTPTAGTWKFTTQASTGSFGIGRIFSTTNAGGWMLYDSDSIGVKFNAAPQIGTLTSPNIPCTGHTYVGVRFQQYTERFRDTFLLQVSNNGGTSWTSFPIFPNMGLTSNLSTDNPEVTTINVSSVASNQANVMVRFYYSGAFVGGGYNWLVDDFQMLDLDPVDLGLIKSGAVMTLGGASGNTPMGTQPKLFADTVVPLTSVVNYGGLSQTNTTITGNVYYNGSSVYQATDNFASVPINGYDSIAILGNGYKSTAVGSYLVTYSMNQPNDAVASNNVDTIVYNISDSSLCVFLGYQEATKRLSGYYYNGGYGVIGTTGTKRYVGANFEVPAGKKDTITTVSVCFAPSTVVGASVVVEIYQLDVSGDFYTFKGATQPKTLTAADISTSSALSFTTLPLNIGTGAVKQWLIADEGYWAAVVRPASSSVTQAITIASARPGAPSSIINRYGVLDAYTGTGGLFGLDLGNNQDFFTNEDVPAVVVNFGNSKKLLGVSDIAGLHIGKAFPNPANTTLSIPVSATASSDVTVSLYNMVGQMLMSQNLGTVASGASKTAVFSTGSLASGTYFYTISANGGRVTDRFTVAH